MSKKLYNKFGGFFISMLKKDTANGQCRIHVSVQSYADGQILKTPDRETYPSHDECLELIHKYQKEYRQIDFSERMKAAREKEGLTQQEVADIIGCKVQQYQRWESGAQAPSVKHGRRIADALCCRMDDIF